MIFDALVWYCKPEANGIWAKETDSAFGAYTPCAIESADCISNVVLFVLCAYRLWLVRMDHEVRRFQLTSKCYNYILILLGSCCAAEPLLRLFMGISIFNLDAETDLAPFEVVSTPCYNFSVFLFLPCTSDISFSFCLYQIHHFFIPLAHRKN